MKLFLQQFKLNFQLTLWGIILTGFQLKLVLSVYLHDLL